MCYRDGRGGAGGFVSGSAFCVGWLGVGRCTVGGGAVASGRFGCSWRRGNDRGACRLKTTALSCREGALKRVS
eukprot:2848988-Prymnesium_polylepis.1